MQSIKMDSAYAELVLEGVKTQTMLPNERGVRLGLTNIEFKGAREIGSITVDVTEIVVKRFDDIDSLDACKTAFATPRALQEELLKYYPLLKQHSPVTCIKFTMLED